VSGGPQILAVDMGTGTAKAALVRPDGVISGRATRPISTVHLPGGGAEQDPDEWWAAVSGAAREALAAAGADPADVIAVRCATQWAVTVPVDRDGNALTRAISWMDTRGGPHVRELVDGPIKIGGYDVRKLRRWLALTGGAPVHSGVDGLGHVLHLIHDRPAVYAETAAFLEPVDYLNLRLTGRAAASAGTMFPYWLTDNRDPRRVRYDPTLVGWAGIAPEKLPEILPVDAVVGGLTEEAARALGLAAGTRVLAGLSDAQAASFAAGVVEPGQGYVSIGTTSWLAALVPRKKTDLRHQITTMPAGLPGAHLVVAEQGPAGQCLEHLARVFAPGSELEELEAEAARVPAGSEGLIFTPWLAGVAAPAAEPYTRSAFFNQRVETTRGHYARAVLEGIAYNVRWLQGHVERFARARFDRLAFVGGGAQSELWCQTLADVLGREVGQVAEPRFATARGVGLAGFAALGEIAATDIPAAVEFTASYRPAPDAAAVHDRQFEAFVEIFKRNKRIYRALNRSRG
jgi:xylulokinase